MSPDQLQKLYEKLDLKSRRGRGGDYTYVPWQDVADRMNEVFKGNWSSEVMSETSLNNGVVLRVRVTIIDEKTNIKYYQEGYGGADIAGAEVGTLHKSAYSKALRDACKKWGPGLYTDDVLDFSTKIPTPSKSVSTNIPVSSVPTSPPVANTPVANIPVSSVPTSQPVSNIPVSDTPVLPPVSNTQISKNQISETEKTHNSVVEQIAATPSLPGVQKPIIPPVTKTTNSLPPVSNGTTAQVSVTPPTIESKDDNKINDVQMAALEGILELPDIDAEVLIKEAFEYGNLDTTNLPTKDKLTYQQALIVIKYGNEKFRKKNS